MYYVDREIGGIVNKVIKWVKFFEFFVNCVVCFIGMEVCGGVYYWVW